MKFHIFETRGNKKPCKNAILEKDELFYINIDTLEQLLELIEEIEEDIIIERYGDGCYGIEVYNDYRE